MSSQHVPYSGGIGLVGTLTVVFVDLKLLGLITWSWWWVLSPIWIPISLVVVLLIIAIIIAVVSGD